MEPDVVRMYSSSPPPMEDGAEEEEDEFGDFGTFSGIPNSNSFSEFDTPSTFNQTRALTATSPPELLASRGLVGFSHAPSNGTPSAEPSKANGVGSISHLDSRTETKRPVSSPLDSSLSDGESPECNGGDTQVLTNGFVTFDLQESLSLQNSVCFLIKGTSTEDMGGVLVDSTEDSFADFAAFSASEPHLSEVVNENRDRNQDIHSESHWSPEADVHNQDRSTEDRDSLSAGHRPPEADVHDQDRNLEEETVGMEDRDTNQTGHAVSLQRDWTLDKLEAISSNDHLTLNMTEGCNEAAGDTGDDLSPDLAADSEAGQSDEKSSETSFGRPLSTEALEEYGDVSTTGSVPSPPPHGDTATPAEDDEDFGDFGDAGSFGCQGFGDIQQPEVHQGSAAGPEDLHMEQDNNFGDFNSPKPDTSRNREETREGGGEFPVFPASDSFGNFSSAVGDEDCGWRAFGEEPEQEEKSWVAFSSEPSGKEDGGEGHEGGTPAGGEDLGQTDTHLVLLSSRLEKLFLSSFPPALVQNWQEDQVVSLKILLEPPVDRAEPGAQEDKEEEERTQCSWWRCGSLWSHLQDVQEAVGLRYQWGGSHCNKVLLCSLGIDTRNILFTGQKKQPVIVPMYAAGLGMLEPTKEPVKPVSAAEMIASIAQTPPAAPEMSCQSDSVQDVLPPIQFDWSSSGLTNPLDASGGSSLLNLDFFGPVEDSGSSSSASIPGVDPELFELTTAKMDYSGAGGRVADAFARLMSTMDKTSTSTRKPRRDENLSDEASKVIAVLPDLSFMQAKVLMFPATLTPLSLQVE